MDFYEFLDLCAFDVDKAVEMAKKYKAVKEVLDEVGLEELESNNVPRPDEPPSGLIVTVNARIDFTFGNPCDF